MNVTPLARTSRRCSFAGHMVLLHGFIKKTQATAAQDIALAEKRIDF